MEEHLDDIDKSMTREEARQSLNVSLNAIDLSPFKSHGLHQRTKVSKMRKKLELAYNNLQEKVC